MLASLDPKGCNFISACVHRVFLYSNTDIVYLQSVQFIKIKNVLNCTYAHASMLPQVCVYEC